MLSRPGSKPLAVALVAVLLPVLAAIIGALRDPWWPTGDFAFIALQTLDVPRHMPLFGVYSRFGFHHPGPLIFVAYALPMRLLGPNGLLVAPALVNAAALAASVVLLRRRGGVPLLMIGTTALVLLELAAADQLADPWNPWAPMFPFALAILLAWSVWERDRWALPALAVVLSFCVQSHLGYLLLAIWLFGVALLPVIRSWRRGEPSARRQASTVLLSTVLVGLVVWALPLWDQLRGSGNLGLIVDHLRHSSEPTVGWAEATRLLGRELGLVPPAIGGAEPHTTFTDAVVGRSPLAAVPLLLALAAAAVVARRRHDGPPVRLLAVTGGGLVVGWFSIAHFEGNPFGYLLRWVWPLVAFALTAAVWAVQRAVAGASAGARAAAAADPPASLSAASHPSALRRGVLVAGVVAVATVSIAASATAARAPSPGAPFSNAVGQLIDPVADAVAGRGNVLVPHQVGTWGEMESGIFAELEQRGVPVFVPDEDTFNYGDRRTIGDRPVGAVLVVATADQIAARRAGDRPAGSVLVVSNDPLTPDERADAERLRGLAAQAYEDAVDGVDGPLRLTAEDRRQLARYDRRGRPVDVWLDPAP